MKQKYLFVIGARPNFMKVAPIIRAYRGSKSLQDQAEIVIVHTGQHYDSDMSDSFLKILGLDQIGYHLNVGSGSHAEQTAKIMVEFEKVCLKEQPHWIVVVGDVNSTMACAIVGKKCNAGVCHIEAGLRSFNREMPEEINRLVTDSISDLFLTPSADADAQLLKEGVERSRISLVGNLMIDSLLYHSKSVSTEKISQVLGSFKGRPYAMLTLHRPSNVDSAEVLGPLIDVLERISQKLPIIFPCHPRTRAKLETFGLMARFNSDRFILRGPADYESMLCYYTGAKLVLTDSGGVQEETTALKIPCLTLRTETERPVTVSHGSNIVVGTDSARILKEAERIINQDRAKDYPIPELWDGKAAERVWQALLSSNG